MCLFNIEKSGPEKAEGNVADKKESVNGPENYLNKHTSGFGFIYSRTNKLRDVTAFLDLWLGSNEKKVSTSLEGKHLVPPQYNPRCRQLNRTFCMHRRSGRENFFNFQATSVSFEWFERTRKKLTTFYSRSLSGTRTTTQPVVVNIFLKDYFVCFDAILFFYV